MYIYIYVYIYMYIYIYVKDCRGISVLTLEEQAIWSQLRASGGVDEEAWVWVSGLPEAADAELRELRERVAGLLEVQMDSKEPKGLVSFLYFCFFSFLFWCDSWGMTFPVALLFSGAIGSFGEPQNGGLKPFDFSE